jgi:hypothetical protein
VQRAILERVASSARYGCTIEELAWHAYPDREPTVARAVAVRRAVRALVAEGLLIDQTGFYGRRISMAAPKRPRALKRLPDKVTRWLQCTDCDVQWKAEYEGVETCWSCGKPGSVGRP